MTKLNLSECEFHKKYIVKKIDVIDQVLKRQLENIGLVESESIELVCTNYGKSSYLVKIMDIGFGMDKSLLDKVTVYDK